MVIVAVNIFQRKKYKTFFLNFNYYQLNKLFKPIRNSRFFCVKKYLKNIHCIYNIITIFDSDKNLKIRKHERD